jgi:hypothetical protein
MLTKSSGGSTGGLKHVLLKPFLMQDSSIPTTHLLPGYKAVAGYIGGDTPHVWTKPEWLRFKGIPKLPIYVDTVSVNSYSAGVLAAFDCLNKLWELRVPRGKAVAYDIETRTCPELVRGFEDVMLWAGFIPWIYGSRSTVFKNPARNYWVADYTGVPHWVSHRSRATQYQPEVHNSGQPDIDVSIIRRWQILTGKLWK